MVSRRACLLLLLTLIPALLGGEARREAIVVLADPSLIEQFQSEGLERPLRRERLRSPEAAERLARLRARKARLAAAIRSAGAEMVGETEVVLNTVLVRATEDELAALRKLPGVESAEFAHEYRLLLDSALPLMQVPQAWMLPAIGGEENAGRGVKIAVVDSGIDQDHPMFQDAELRPPPEFPKGDAAFTNNKVIVARNFTSERTVADNLGHGTFVAAVAAGRRVQVQLPQVPPVSISGVAPKAFLGSYRVFSTSGSTEETRVMRSFESAVVDGMDIINLSLGIPDPPPSSSDPLLRMIQNATAAGVLVVAAAGNEGPGARTIASPATLAPVLAVGATTTTRRISGAVKVTARDAVPPLLAEISAFPGSEPQQNGSFGPNPLVDVIPLDPSGLACPPSGEVPTGVNLPPNSLAGKVVLIKRGRCFFRDKIRNAEGAGAVGAVIYNHLSGTIRMLTEGNRIRSMSIDNEEGVALQQFLARARDAQVSFDPDLVARRTQPDVLVDSSSRGPTPDLTIKPDVVAPGESILSATQNLNPDSDMFDASRFFVASGTSFAAPMAVGAAALVKQAHPNYRPEQIKSALVNTADPITLTQERSAVSVQKVGVGRINVQAAVNATVVAEPVSLSFGVRAPRSTFRESQPLKITNTGGASDTLTLSVAPRQPHPNLTVQLDQSSVTLASSGSTQVMMTMFNTGVPQTAAEGMVNIRSRATNSSINVPYWVTFVPEVNPGGVVNGASFQGASGVAPGSIVSIFGVALSSAVAGAVGLPLPTALGGTKIVLNSTNVPLFFTSGGQVNAQIPFEASPGTTAAATLSVDGIPNPPSSFSIPITQFAPGLFSRSQDGRGSGAILHADGTPVSSDSPARAGETVLLFGTGLGAVNSPPATGSPATADPLSTTLSQPTVTIGGREAAVSFSGLAPGFVGLYQVNATVPTGLAAGQHPVVLTIGGVSSNTVTISVR